MGLVAAVGTAVTAVAAEVGVAVTATAMSVGFETIAAVGAGLGVIGSVTHNKVLSYVGMGLGLVGGVGALAASAGVIGAGAAGAGAADAASTSPFVAQAGDAAAGSDVVSSMSPDLVDQTAGAAEFGNAATPGSLADAAATRPDFLGPGAASSPATDNLGFNGAGTSGRPLTIAATDNTGSVAGASTAQGPPAQGSAASASAPASESFTPPTPPGGLGAYDAAGKLITSGTDSAGMNVSLSGQAGGGGNSALGGIMDFVKNNQLLAYGAVQAGGSFLQGMTSTLTPANVAQLNAQAAANNAAASLTNMQVANLSQPRSGATLAPVTGKPGTPIVSAPPAGLINGAAPVSVTGVPA